MSLFDGRKKDLMDEIESHLQMATADRVAAGATPEDARRDVGREFGNVPLIVDVTRERWGWMRMEQLAQDLRYAWRTLKRDRGFATVAILILALGIGANIVVFSVVNTILLRPLPFTDPQQLLWLAAGHDGGGLTVVTYRADAYEAYRDHTHSFQEITGFSPFYAYSDFKLTGYGEPQPVAGVWVLCNFFQTLGVKPLLGRNFTKEESVKGGPSAVILSYPYWQSHFRGDQSIVGRAITLDGSQVTIAGVLPPSFDFGSVFAPGMKKDVFRVLHIEDVLQVGHVLSLIGRLKPGVTSAQAQAEASVLFPQLRDAAKSNDWMNDADTSITGLKDHVNRQLRRPLLILWCAVGLVLLIVCVNLSNLLLARAMARSKEFAMRTALGANRTRLIRQLLTESFVLSILGALIGLAIAFAVLTYLAHQGSVSLPLLSTVRMDGNTLLLTLVIALFASILFGIVPAVKISGGNLQEVLKDSGHGTSAGRKQDRVRSTLVVTEIVLTCVLLVGAGLLMRSFLNVLNVDLGFQPSHTSALHVSYNAPTDAQRGPVLEEMLRRVSEIPGVESASFSDALPLTHNRSWTLNAKGRSYPRDAHQDVFVSVVSPEFFNTMGMRLIDGRDFAWTDTPTSRPVIIINEATARRDWPGENPIGKEATGIGNGDTTVIGVVANIHESNIETAPNPEIYVPVTQSGDISGSELVVRSGLPIETLEPSLIRTLRSMNPGQPTTSLVPLQDIVDHSIAPRQFFAVLVGIFAAFGLLLASLGIYGVTSYSVSRQTQEIGIRMALGATRERVQMGVISKTLRLALIGTAVGTGTSFAVAKAIRSMLFGTTPTDPMTFVGMIVLLIGVALLASYLPARRASRINPVTAIRSS